MANRSEFEKYYYFMIISGVVILLVDIYYYAHPLWRGVGWTHEIADSLMLRLRSGGVFVSPWKSKALALVLLSGTLLTRSGKGKKVPLWISLSVLAVGLLLFFLAPTGHPLRFVIMTLFGAVFSCWGLGMAGRKLSHFHEAVNDRNETFAQCTEKMETSNSINIPTVFQYKGRLRNGWINVVNPYRATLVLGSPGAGKSYSVYGPYIEQMIAKGFSLFVYDYKYPDLTEIVYNELLLNKDAYEVMPEFCVINFQDPRYSLRCNPIHPRYITDPADTTEIAELVMLNVNKQAIEKEDFFTLSAKVYLDALIWFLKIYENGRYCTFPHVIEMMAQDYKKVFKILSRYPELEAKIKPFQNALEGNAQDQLQGQIASAQIPLNKFVSKKLYWVLTGNDFDLAINDPAHPKILCVGNDPDRQSIYGTTLALYTSRLFKTVNHKGKLKSGILLDELPTIYLKGLDNLIATARSNKVAIVMGAQDESQVKRDYGDKESEVIFNTVGNIFSGQVSGKTAEKLSKAFGKEFRKRESQTRNIDSDSVSVSFQQEELLPVSTIETLSQGVFFGKVADNNDEKIQNKFFCGEIQRDRKEMEEKRKNWKRLPELTDFGKKEVWKRVYANSERSLAEYFAKEMRKDGSILYADDELETESYARAKAIMESKQEGPLLNMIAEEIYSDIVEMRIQKNFDRIQSDVRNIIAKETGQGMQEVKALPKEENEIDPQVVDPFAD